MTPRSPGPRSRLAWLPALLLVSLLLLPEGAGAQGFGKNKVQYRDFDWQVLETPHFQIHFYQGAERLAGETSVILENAYQVLQERLRHSLPWKVPVILYVSQNDFQQTNVSTELIPEGVAAFAEPSKKRVVLPYLGSHAEFVHTALHELVHVFTFDMVYQGLLDSVFTRRYLFRIPLWFAEGLAEYYSTGWDNSADMYIRDATIRDYLMDLHRAGGFYVYKEGQAALNFLTERYGEAKLIELLDNLGMTRDLNRALKTSIGLRVEEFSDIWKKEMRRTYWPLYADLAEADDLGRALTDHQETHSFYNVKPSISPDGQLIAFFGDRGGTVNIYLMSAIDGKIVRKLVSGYTSNRFESVHFFKSSISWSPDGESIVFVAKSGGRDKIFVQRVRDGDVLRVLDPKLDQIRSPAWSPVKDEVVLSGSVGGQTDLFLVDLGSGGVRRLTDDLEDELEPRWFPDGERIVFSRYPRISPEFTFAETPEGRLIEDVDYLSVDNVKEGAQHDIWAYEVATGRLEVLVATPGEDRSPLVLPDGKTLIFSSDASGIDNLYRGDLETGEFHRFTDVLGGLFNPDVCPVEDRLTFSAFREAGFDIFVVENFAEFSSTDYEVPEADEYARIRRVRGLHLKDEEEPAVFLGRTRGAGGETTPSPEEQDAGPAPVVVGDSVGTFNFVTPSRGFREEEPGSTAFLATPEDTLDGEPNRGEVHDYKIKFTPDYIGQGPGIFYSTGFGFAFANQIALSDLLGNHRLLFSFNFFRSLEDSDLLATYMYLKKRFDIGVGAFQFTNYLNSRVTSVGEAFREYRLFKERNYGLLGLVSYPHSKFTRLDLEIQAFVSEIEFFDPVTSASDSSLIFLETTGRQQRRLIQPTLSLIHDTARYGSFGPMAGSRWILSLARAISLSDQDISRWIGIADYRAYLPLFYRNAFAVQLLGAWSEGGEAQRDARRFFLGGHGTLRGYDYLEFEGRKLALAKLEYRFPLIDALIFGWPGRWGITNVGGTLFFDSGVAWDRHDPVLLRKDVNGLRLQDLKADFGIGFTMWLLYFPMNFSFAWQTDLRSVGDYQFHFYLGPQF